MDQGLAAVIAAGVAGAAGLLGVRVGRRTVRDQALVEHGQWLRGQRQEAYVQLLDVWDAAIRAFEAILEDPDHRREVARYEDEQRNIDGWGHLGDELFDEVEQISGPVNEALERVRLLGPESLEKAAMNLEDALLGLGGAMRAGTSDGTWPKHDVWAEMKRNATECRRDFFDLSRGVIRTAPDTRRRRLR
ncbi:hypothetical protein ACFY8X_38580 [Streptomyces tanashiensis]|uniref:hypothetical protein n=1 Tax=Streptomyces tanashiensis TaxID=67367 RepID=UPI0036E38671